MKVAAVGMLPPVGPTWTPAIGSLSQATAPSSTKSESVEAIARPPHTMLESRECCHVARMVPFSSGLGLKKWVMTCLWLSLNSVASGVKRSQANPEVSGHCDAGVLGFGQGRQM